MANKVVMEFKRGDGVTHEFWLPLDAYVAGSKLYFAAKPEPDNDLTDAAAVIDKQFDDSDVNLVTNPGYATYTLDFGAADITGVSYQDGETQLTYDGEFQYIVSGQDPVSFPGNDDYIQVIIYADIRRAVV